jgi:hypothetical protein
MLCTFDFIQYSFALSISSLFLFHSHIHFNLYSLTYTYPFNLQSQKRIKKLFIVGFVGNFGSFSLFLFASEVDSIEIFKFWTGFARLEIFFLVLGEKKRRRRGIPEPAWTRPDPHYPRPIGLTIHYAGCGSRFSNPFTAGRVVKNMQIRPNPARAHPYLRLE